MGTRQFKRTRPEPLWKGSRSSHCLTPLHPPPPRTSSCCSATRRRQRRGALSVPHLPLRCTTQTAQRPTRPPDLYAGPDPPAAVPAAAAAAAAAPPAALPPGGGRASSAALLPSGLRAVGRRTKRSKVVQRGLIVECSPGRRDGARGVVSSEVPLQARASARACTRLWQQGCQGQGTCMYKAIV